MKEAFRHWPEIARRLKSARSGLLLFDYDGTVVPIARTPAEARMKPSMRRRLQRLNALPNSHVGFISGRTLSDLKKHVAIRRLPYSGNHGIEIHAFGEKFVEPQARKSKTKIARLARQVRAVMKSIPGAFIEDKRLSAGFHYRKVPTTHEKTFIQLIETHVLPFAEQHGLYVRRGKKVFEVRPTQNWNKGSAVNWMRKKVDRALIFYIGDDSTDEDAFAVLRRPDISVRVGNKRGSKAEFFVRGQREVPRLIDEMIKVLEDR